MKPSVYIDTTVISYLTAWPARDLVRAAQQQTTREWWDTQRHRFDLFVSQLVIIEASGGDSSAAQDRLIALKNIPLLDVTDAAASLANQLTASGSIPIQASRDALHVGTCAVNGVQFLLTWNFKHLANAQMQDRIRETCRIAGYEPPVICSPDALFEV